MAQVAAPFSYGAEEHRGSDIKASVSAEVSIFADRLRLRDQSLDMASQAGMRVRQSGGLDRLQQDDLPVLGDIVLVDAPIVDATLLSSLVRLDEQLARSGTELILSTSEDALDDVFSAVDRTSAQILVMPSEAERALAIGVALARMPGRSVREIGAEDRMALMRLTEQVSMLARRIEGLSTEEKESGDARTSSAEQGFISLTPRHERASARRGGTADLPPAGLVREIIRQRQLRSKFFDAELFADPAWDILLDLTAAQSEGAQVSVSSLCIAACVPPTTALRWIAQMTDTGLLQRVQDEADWRRAFIALSGKSVTAMAEYFRALGGSEAMI